VPWWLKIQFDKVSQFERVHTVGKFFCVFLNLRPAGGWQNQNRQTPAGEILLVTQVLVGRDENVEGLFRSG
jgi:hypothetical protein